MRTRPLLRNVHHRAMIMPVGTLRTAAYSYQPELLDNSSFICNNSQMGLSTEWNSNPMSYANPLLQKTFNLT